MTPTYLQRVQQVLREVAINNESSIEHQMLIYRVRSRKLRSSDEAYSPFRLDVNAALAFLSQAGYVRIDRVHKPPLVRITPAGKHVFASMAPLPTPITPSRKLVRFRRASFKEKALQDYINLAEIITLIQDVVAERSSNPSKRCPVDQLVPTIRAYLDDSEGLKGQTQDCNKELNLISSEFASRSADVAEGIYYNVDEEDEDDENEVERAT